MVVPPIILFFSKHPIIAKYDFSSVHTMLVGAAPTGGETVLEAIERTKVPRIRQGLPHFLYFFHNLLILKDVSDCVKC